MYVEIANISDLILFSYLVSRSVPFPPYLYGAGSHRSRYGTKARRGKVFPFQLLVHNTQVEVGKVNYLIHSTPRERKFARFTSMKQTDKRGAGRLDRPPPTEDPLISNPIGVCLSLLWAAKARRNRIRPDLRGII